MPWLEQVTKPSQQVVYCLKKTSKGLILKTPEYDVFLWAEHKLSKQLLEALAFWENNNGLGTELVVIPDKTTKLGFKVLPGKPVTYFQLENSWTTEPPEEEDEGNPFLSATQFANSPAHPVPANGSERANAKKRAKDLQANLTPEDPRKP